MVIPENSTLDISTTVTDPENNLVKITETSFTDNCNQCHNLATMTCRKDDSVAMDVENCEPVSKHTQKEENVLSENMSYCHQLTKWYNKRSSVPFSYLIGIPVGWLMLGIFQYFVCVVNLGDSLLDPWFFSCTWIVEAICLLHVTMIITIVKCLYVRVEVLKYCDKITWAGFTFLLFQGLVIILLLLPISNLYKHVVGDFSKPINFFTYWLMIAFPHFMITCFATFGCCSKIFR
ncbi:Hypothetical protein CINCED_3A010837 [Cinara cedri]|uniref:Uncharacterized protein n=1 Tax=Cinara cedri TaxID=506608 RepID=A0A5E4M3W4_9HEMI|nr:Hypothetical protein CINCED_3A010837 [Cinara cedri]